MAVFDKSSTTKGRRTRLIGRRCEIDLSSIRPFSDQIKSNLYLLKWEKRENNWQ